ncbi:uncharacterized protein A1O5_06849 [Cladophialophora psammophila CBS 110553]|uniref:Uncharacterized protein n=1 Tax=Cladophialophora psammophila CBS 110553 TaxID=1182543 RepID=W9WPE3_9EURO|nr:uncharacterized protein A1O5_06849 [Cladophialophora psammophila CBS 110553]EXJ69778.1 hypothetical protein A1O5_06849 [Cladophialophora psammophila CBS 110553]
MFGKVLRHVAENEPIRLVVLASQLSQYEGVPRGRKFEPESNLTRFDELCKHISTIYSPGARVDVVMDGLIHNDLFGVGDVEEWESIKAMEEAAAKRHSGTLNILPIWNLLEDEHDDIPLPLEEARFYFLHHAQLLKDHLISRFGNPNNDSITIPPTFKAIYVSEQYSKLCGGENKNTAAKVALHVDT